MRLVPVEGDPFADAAPPPAPQTAPAAPPIAGPETTPPSVPQSPSPQGQAPIIQGPARVRSNLERMIDQNAPETEIENYLSLEGYSREQWIAAARDLDKSLDKERGAPVRVREKVGSAVKPEDRLANLRGYYPDAIPYGTDNFVFTDPETKQLTLYNPPGLDLGDAASMSKEITEGVGGTLGAAAGVAAGPVGAVGGAALGTALGTAAYDAMRGVRGDVDTRTTPERLTDTAVSGAAGAIGQRMGEVIDQGGRALVGASRRRASGEAARVAQDFIDEGVTPPAGAVSGSRMVQATEETLKNMPASAGRMQDYSAGIIDSFQSAAGRLADEFGERLTPQGAGEVIQDAAKGAAGRFKTQQEQAYRRAFDKVGPDTPASVPAVQALVKSLEAELARAPNRANVIRPALQRAQAIAADAGRREGLPFDALRATRTDIGRDLDSPVLAGSTGAQNESMRRLYGALTDDMKETAKAAGGDHELAVADRYTRRIMTQSMPTLQKIEDFDAPEKAFKFALQEGRDGATRLSRLRRNFLPTEWDTVAGTVLGRMGLAKAGTQNAAGDQFSVATFLTNWNNLSREAKRALFGGTRYRDLQPSLDRLTRIGSSLKEVDKTANPSGTARQLAYMHTMQALGTGTVGAAGGALLGGDTGSAVSGAALTVGGSILAPRLVSRLITSPRFVRWLSAAPTAMQTANKSSAHLGRLIGIAQVEPELREAIHGYLTALRAAPVPESRTSPDPQR